MHACMHGCMHACMHACMYVCMYVCIAGGRTRSQGRSRLAPCLGMHTVGFHNFNLRIFNLRVSNPNKLIVDVFFFTRCRISTCQGLGPKKHDEISEIDRTYFSGPLHASRVYIPQRGVQWKQGVVVYIIV